MNEIVEEVQSHKHLGITLDQNLKWDLEVSQKTKKMSNLVNMMRPLKNILPRKALEVIYLSLIRPLAEYAAPYFGKLNCVLSQSLESVQYQAGLIVSGLPKTTGYMTVLDEMSWSPLEARRTALRCTMFYKILNRNAPVYLVEILNASYLVRRESQYSLRHEGSAKTICE